MPGIRVRDMFATFKTLSGREKLQYAWDYFRYPILVIGCLVLFLGSALIRYVTYREPTLQVMLVNPDCTVNSQEPWFDAFFAQYGYERFEGDLEIMSFSLANDDSFTRDDSFLSMSVYLNAGTDLFVGNGEAYERIAQEGALADLSRLLPEDLLKAYEDQLLYSTDGGMVESYPCAIFVQDNSWLEETGCYSDGCYFAVCGQSANMQVSLDFIEYLLETGMDP